MNTLEEMKSLKDELEERRRIEAFRVASAHHDAQIDKLNRLHTAIAALDAVISEGKDAPKDGEPRITFVG